MFVGLHYLRNGCQKKDKGPVSGLLCGVRAIEEHRPFGFAQGKQECLCHNGKSAP
jgi:hypothetical protein